MELTKSDKLNLFIVIPILTLVLGWNIFDISRELYILNNGEKYFVKVIKSEEKYRLHRYILSFEHEGKIYEGVSYAEAKIGHYIDARKCDNIDILVPYKNAYSNRIKILIFCSFFFFVLSLPLFLEIFHAIGLFLKTHI